MLWILTQLLYVLEQYKNAHPRFCFESWIKTSVKNSCAFFFKTQLGIQIWETLGMLHRVKMFLVFVDVYSWK